jgi:hypothetical protein
MAGPGETLGIPWPPLAVRPCMGRLGEWRDPEHRPGFFLALRPFDPLCASDAFRCRENLKQATQPMSKEGKTLPHQVLSFFLFNCFNDEFELDLMMRKQERATVTRREAIST